MTDSVVSKRARRLVRVLRSATTIFIVLTVLALVLFVLTLVQGLAGGVIHLPLHVLLNEHAVFPAPGANHVVASITPVASQVDVSIKHAPVGAVLLSGASNVVTLLIGGVSAVIIRNALSRLEVGQPFSAVLARSLTVVAVVTAVGGVIADLSGWLAEVLLVGTPLTVGGKTYPTTIESWVPDLIGLYFAGLVFVVALIIRTGAAMQSELEEVV